MVHLFAYYSIAKHRLRFGKVKNKGVYFSIALNLHYICISKLLRIGLMDNIDWKDKLGAAFNIDPESVQKEEQPEIENKMSVDLSKQRIDIMLDKRNRNGKKVTIMAGFECDDEELKVIAKDLKQQCGVGGSARGGEILIQGDFREKLKALLMAKGYKARVI